MKKVIYFFILSIYLVPNIWSQAPVFSWAKQFGGTNTETGRCVAADANGNVYSTGVFSGTTDFDPGAGTYNLVATGGQDVYVSKLDSSGNFVWAVKIGGVVTDNSQAIKVDNSGNVYVTGSFNGTCSFGAFNLTSSGMGDAYVCKLDNAGNFIWAKKMGGTGNDAALGIHVDGTGKVFTTGYFSATADFDPDAPTVNLVSSGGLDIFVSQLDVSGAYLAAYKMGGANFDLGFDITLDGSGNIYTTGYFNGSVDFDPGAGTTTLNAGTGEDIFISKLDALGNSVWAKNMAGTSFSNTGYAIMVDGTGNVYSTGYFSGTIDFDPGAGTTNLNSAGGTDSYVSKLDASGNFVWVKQTGGSGNDGAYAISLDAGGNVYTAGDFENTVDFDPGGGTFNMTSSLLDVYVSKLDASGNFVTALQIATGNGDPFLTVDNASRVYITGGFLGTTDFDAGAGVSNLSAVGGTDAYVTRYIIPGCAVPSQPATISGPTPICAGSSNTYSAATVAGATSYTWTLPSGWTGTSTVDSIITTASTTSGNISVTANNACGSSTAQTLFVMVNTVPPTTGPILGSTTVCAGSNNLYSTLPIPGATSYTWTLPSGWTGTSSTNSINTTASSTSGNVIVTADNACGSASPETLFVTVNTSPPTPGTISGPTSICEGTSNIYSITAVSGATSYSWTLPSGWSGTSTTTSINTTSGSTSGNITVTADNSCGSSSPQSLLITVNLLPTVNFIYPGLDTVCANYAVQSLSGGTPSGGTYSGPGVTGANFDPNLAGVGSHPIIYSYTDANSCSGSDTTTITVIGCAGVENWEESITVYPNPFTDFISISGLKENTEVKLYNMLGEMIYILNFDQSNAILLTNELTPGLYLLRVGDQTVKIIRK